MATSSVLLSPYPWVLLSRSNQLHQVYGEADERHRHRPSRNEGLVGLGCPRHRAIATLGNGSRNWLQAPVGQKGRQETRNDRAQMVDQVYILGDGGRCAGDGWRDAPPSPQSEKDET